MSREQFLAVIKEIGPWDAYYPSRQKIEGKSFAISKVQDRGDGYVACNAVDAAGMERTFHSVKLERVDDERVKG